MRKILKGFLVATFVFLIFLPVEVSAAFCDWARPESANCFPVSQADELGINLNQTSASWTISYCEDLTTSNFEEFACINPIFPTTPTTCPSSGYTCTLYQDAAPPGPVAGGFIDCTVGNTRYSCCSQGDLIINGRCVALEDWITLADRCCSSGESSCTTTSGQAGYCSSYDGGFVCQGNGICTPLDDSANLDEPGEQYCNCTLGQGQWFCNLSNSNASDFSQSQLAGCADWASPNQGACPDTVSIRDIDDVCTSSRDSRCYARVSCVSQIPPDTISSYKEHGESCTLFYDQAVSDTTPAPHDCNPAEGLICQPTYNICVYPDGSRGGWGADASESSCVWGRECSTGVGYQQGEYDQQECVTADRLTECSLSNPRSDCSCRFPESISCEWTPYENPESPYHGRPAFCVSGFRTPEDIWASEAVFDCEDNCGGILLQLAAALSGWDGQHVSLDGFVAGRDDEGFYYTCMTGDFDGSIQATIEDCLADQGIATVTTGGVGAVIGAMVPGPNVVTIPIAAAGGAKIGSSIFNCAPTISGSVEMANGWNSCQANLRIEVDLSTEAGNLDGLHDPYRVCELNLRAGSQAYNDCIECYGTDISKGKIWTAVGCIEQDHQGLILKLVLTGVGITGGIFLLRILAAAFILTVSQGDVKKTSEAKEMITEAIIGVLFILFTVTILQFIGSDVMRIPGFGS